jgi:hypothetical protein
MKPPPSARRRWVELVFGFIWIFAGLSLPSRGIGPIWVQSHALVGNALLPEELDSGVKLSFRVDEASLEPQPWSLPLVVEPPAPRAAITLPMDVRTLSFLPTACFVALAVATPMASWRRNVRLLLVGLAILEPLLLGLNALPLLSFLGGTGPVRAFELSLATHTVLQVLYRALVASPAMAYAVPFFLWWVLVRSAGAPSEIRRTIRNPEATALAASGK